MITQQFYIGNGKDRWKISAYYNIEFITDRDIVYGALTKNGCDEEKARKALRILSRENTGYTFTNFGNKETIVCASCSSDYDEMFSTITHEIKHVVEHISEYYEVDPKSEEAAYLQGEISKQMYKAVAMTICPKCNCKTELT